MNKDGVYVLLEIDLMKKAIELEGDKIVKLENDKGSNLDNVIKIIDGKEYVLIRLAEDVVKDLMIYMEDKNINDFNEVIRIIIEKKGERNNG